MKTLRIAVLVAAVAVPSLAFAQDQQTNPPPPVGGVGGAVGGAVVGGVVGGPVGAAVGAGVGAIVGSSLPPRLPSSTANPWWWDKRCQIA
jgi:outer membrane lipoprotein SlyB